MRFLRRPRGFRGGVGRGLGGGVLFPRLMFHVVMGGGEVFFAEFECFEDLELLWSCCFEPCFDFFFCSETAFAESCCFVDGADGDAGRDDSCISSDGCFGGGVGSCHGL